MVSLPAMRQLPEREWPNSLMGKETGQICRTFMCYRAFGWEYLPSLLLYSLCHQSPLLLICGQKKGG